METIVRNLRWVFAGVLILLVAAIWTGVANGQALLSTPDLASPSSAGGLIAHFARTDINPQLNSGDSLQANEGAQSSSDQFEIEFRGRVQSIADGFWIVKGIELVITPQTEVHGDIQIDDWVAVRATLGGEHQLIALEIKLTDAADQDRDGIEFKGIVESMSDTFWTIAGHEIWVTPDTKIEGEIQIGDLVKVHAFFGEGDRLIAREIELASDGAHDSKTDSDEDSYQGDDAQNSSHDYQEESDEHRYDAQDDANPDGTHDESHVGDVDGRHEEDHSDHDGD